MKKEIVEHIAYEKGIEEGLERGKRECNRVIPIREDLAYEKGLEAGLESGHVGGFVAGYDEGLLAGLTKSIVLIRHLQRSDGRSHCNEEVREILDEAMELIAEKIETNNNE